jgi:LemA protein
MGFVLAVVFIIAIIASWLILLVTGVVPFNSGTLAVMLILVVVGIPLGLVLGLWFVYNNLVTVRQRVNEAWASMDVQLNRRASLIPNLVETVRGYAGHERVTLESVIRARGMLSTATSPQQAAQADNMLTGTLRSLFAVAEAYPDLKANQNFLALQSELSDVESKIAFARQFYNTQARDYNVLAHGFPGMLLARRFGYETREMFEAAEPARAEVRVSFSS